MVTFQILNLMISFANKKYYQNLFEDGMSVMFNRFLSIKCLFITKLLVVGQFIAVSKLLLFLVDGTLFSVCSITLELETVMLLTLEC